MIRDKQQHLKIKQSQSSLNQYSDLGTRKDQIVHGLSKQILELLHPQWLGPWGDFEKIDFPYQQPVHIAEGDFGNGRLLNGEGGLFIDIE